jgi:uncharacterized protein YfaS (alpha-2-macroglobulin family)
MTRVHLACEICDAPLRATVAFVEFVAALDQSDLSVTVTSATDPSGTKTWQLAFSGRGQFAGETRTLTVSVPASATADETRTAVARTLRFGLAEYAARSDAAPHLDVTFKTTQAARTSRLPRRRSSGAQAHARCIPTTLLRRTIVASCSRSPSDQTVCRVR